MSRQRQEPRMPGMLKIRSPQQKTCVLCGRVGTRVFKRGPRGDVCTNTKACVTRLCDKVFLDKPKPKLVGDMVFLGTLMENVKLYGVQGEQGPPDPNPTVMAVQGQHSYTFKMEEANFGVLQAILGGTP